MKLAGNTWAALSVGLSMPKLKVIFQIKYYFDIVTYHISEMISHLGHGRGLEVVSEERVR